MERTSYTRERKRVTELKRLALREIRNYNFETTCLEDEITPDEQEMASIATARVIDLMERYDMASDEIQRICKFIAHFAEELPSMPARAPKRSQD